MGVISVRLDNGTEARLRQEAKAQGMGFSAFLRARLTGEKQELPVSDGKGLAESVEDGLRQIAEFLLRMEQEQKESHCITQMMIYNSMWLLLPQNRENVKRLWSVSLKNAKDHLAKQEESQS